MILISAGFARGMKAQRPAATFGCFFRLTQYHLGLSIGN